MKKNILIILSGFLISGCNTSSDNKNEADILNTKSDTLQSVNISREVLDDMMQTLPSPIEMANLITQSKGGFKKELLIPSENAESYSDKYSQALALGGYGVDLGYLNLNNKMLYTMNYLESINTVSKELRVNQFLDFSVLSTLAKNRNNVDSLIQISTNNFNQINEYLRSQNRGDLSVLILVGSWLEGLHMFTAIVQENPSDEVKKRIGEQKVIIDNIYAILNKIENIPYYKDLKMKLAGLKKAYAHVKISYIYKEPEMKEVNGELVVTDNSESIIEVAPADIQTISIEVKKLRSDIFLIDK
ncbi:hypothetical protein CNR22_23065 [Sphingobacteriaceae bacterium]|nr:hypothetical protein CNR22_23065 [Sphingobacteriaceae bacterium]